MKTNITCIICNNQFWQKNETDSPICNQCNIIINRVMKRKDFVKKCGELLAVAKPHLIKCEYMFGKDINDNRCDRVPVHEEDECVLVTCENGYTYTINITGNSLNAIAEAIFKAMASK